MNPIMAPIIIFPFSISGLSFSYNEIVILGRGVRKPIAIVHDLAGRMDLEPTKFEGAGVDGAFLNDVNTLL